MRTLAVLPSRFASTRFPGKPLARIAGKAMVQWVWEAASAAPGVDRVVVATDDERIWKAVHEFGGEVVITDPNLPSGTDRVAAALEALGEPFDVVVNIQGDEPAMHPDTIGAVVDLMRNRPDLPMGTAACPFADLDEVFNPNAVKVVLDARSRALYFSRAVVPFVKEGHFPLRRHIGVYGFQRSVLLRIPPLPSSGLAEAESLEQLRFLENGIPMHVLDATGDPWGIETRSDYDAFLQRRAARGNAAANRNNR
mgnify:CR=1 FL=1